MRAALFRPVTARFSLAIASVLVITGCAVYPGERAPGSFDIRAGQPVPQAGTALPPGAAPQSTYQPYAGPQTAPPPAYQQPAYQEPVPGYQQPPPYHSGFNPGYPQPGPAYGQSSLACSIQGGDFDFFSEKTRKYQPVSFAVAPGETQQLEVIQDDGRRRDRFYVQGDLSGVGVRLTRSRPPEPNAGYTPFGASGSFASTEPELVRGVSQTLNIKNLFQGATMTCGFRSPPGVLPGRRYRGY